MAHVSTKEAETFLGRVEEITGTLPRAQNPAPMTIRDGERVDFTISNDPSVLNQVQRVRGLTALGYYHQQKELLDAFHENVSTAVLRVAVPERGRIQEDARLGVSSG